MRIHDMVAGLRGRRRRGPVPRARIRVREGGREEKAARREPDELTVVFSSDLLGKMRSCGCVIEDMGGLGRWATFTERVRESVDNLIVVDAGDAFGAGALVHAERGGARVRRDERRRPRCVHARRDGFRVRAAVPAQSSRAARSSRSSRRTSSIRRRGSGYSARPTRSRRSRAGCASRSPAFSTTRSAFPPTSTSRSSRCCPRSKRSGSSFPSSRTKADFLIVLSHMGMERSLELARQVGDFDLVVVGHGKPVIKQLEKQGKSIMLATGGSGQYMGRIDLSLSAAGVIERGADEAPAAR